MRALIEGFQMMTSLAENVDRAVTAQLYRAKRSVFRSAVQLVLFLLAVGFIVVGIVLFLMRFFSVDIVLVVFGLVLLYIIMLTTKFR